MHPHVPPLISNLSQSSKILNIDLILTRFIFRDLDNVTSFYFQIYRHLKETSNLCDPKYVNIQVFYTNDLQILRYHQLRHYQIVIVKKYIFSFYVHDTYL